MSRISTSIESPVQWIYTQYINTFYLKPVKTLYGINVFSLEARDVLLTLSHNHLNQRERIDFESSTVSVMVSFYDRDISMGNKKQ